MNMIGIGICATLTFCTTAFDAYGQARNDPENLPANQNNSLVFLQCS
jgi:hypothetical protein